MNPPRWTRPSLTVIGGSLTVFAAVRVMTYPFGMSLPLVFGDTAMAFSTACAFLLTGLGFLVIARTPNGETL